MTPSTVKPKVGEVWIAKIYGDLRTVKVVGSFIGGSLVWSSLTHRHLRVSRRHMLHRVDNTIPLRIRTDS